MNKVKLQNILEDIAYTYFGYIYENIIAHYDEIEDIINSDEPISAMNSLRFAKFFRTHTVIKRLFNEKSIDNIVEQEYDNDIDIKNFLYDINEHIVFRYAYNYNTPNSNRITRAYFNHIGDTYNITVNVYKEEIRNFFIRIKKLEKFLDMHSLDIPMRYFNYAVPFIHELNHLYNDYRSNKAYNNSKFKYRNTKDSSNFKMYINNKSEVDARLTEFIFKEPLYKLSDDAQYNIPIGFNEYCKKYIEYCNHKGYSMMTNRNIKRGLRKLYKIYYSENLKSKIIKMQANLIEADRYEKNRSKNNSFYKNIHDKISNIVNKIIISDDEK